MNEQDPLPRWTLGATAGLMLIIAAAILAVLLKPLAIAAAILLAIGLIGWAALQHWHRSDR